MSSSEVRFAYTKATRSSPKTGLKVRMRACVWTYALKRHIFPHGCVGAQGRFCGRGGVPRALGAAQVISTPNTCLIGPRALDHPRRGGHWIENVNNGKPLLRKADAIRSLTQPIGSVAQVVTHSTNRISRSSSYSGSLPRRYRVLPHQFAAVRQSKDPSGKISVCIRHACLPAEGDGLLLLRSNRTSCWGTRWWRWRTWRASGCSLRLGTTCSGRSVTANERGHVGRED